MSKHIDALQETETRKRSKARPAFPKAFLRAPAEAFDAAAKQREIRISKKTAYLIGAIAGALIVGAYAIGILQGVVAGHDRAGVINRESKIREAQVEKISVARNASIPVQIPSTQMFVEEPAETLPELFYTIQVAAYQDLDRAKMEMQKLKTFGYDVFIHRHNSYFRVCIERFAGKDSALSRRSALSSFLNTQKYTGAFIRRVKEEDVV